MKNNKCFQCKGTGKTYCYRRGQITCSKCGGKGFIRRDVKVRI